MYSFIGRPFGMTDVLPRDQNIVVIATNELNNNIFSVGQIKHSLVTFNWMALFTSEHSK